MAHRLECGGELPFMYNVSNKVGDTTDSVNERGDVELVNYLLDKVVCPKMHTKATEAKIIVNGNFTACTGYWIFALQQARHMQVDKTVKVDGIISPAKYYNSRIWTIALLNNQLYKVDRNAFMNLPNNPFLSATLKSQLSGTRII
ncbi:MAG: hypothetical protein ACK5NT_10290 [Pyrinomonadaceae bacterium]